MGVRNPCREAYFVGATEATKELQMPCNSCHLALPQTLIDKNKELQEQNTKAKEIIRELTKYVSDSKWYVQKGYTELQKELVANAEALLKE